MAAEFYDELGARPVRIDHGAADDHVEAGDRDAVPLTGLEEVHFNGVNAGEHACGVASLETQGGPKSQWHHDRIRANRDYPFERSWQLDSLRCKVASSFHGL